MKKIKNTIAVCFLVASPFAFGSIGDGTQSLYTYIESESFSNILPIKDIIDDEWTQAPKSNSSHAFTQNELGFIARWNRFSFGFGHRYDYFVYTNSDTADLFYADRISSPLADKEHDIKLRMHHQRSNGIRLGYQWDIKGVTTEIKVGYWNVLATRDSQLQGGVTSLSEGNGDSIYTGSVDLKEYYSKQNFLRRPNNNSWNTDGWGATIDFSIVWPVNEYLEMHLDIKDLYSHFKLSDIGFSQGGLNTDTRSINELGRESFLPLYRGVEKRKDYKFSLPERINFVSRYEVNDIYYLARYKRQGEVDFYYLGGEVDTNYGHFSLMLDIENTSPEFRYKSSWLTFNLASDKLKFEEAMQFTFGVALNVSF